MSRFELVADNSLGLHAILHLAGDRYVKVDPGDVPVLERYTWRPHIDIYGRISGIYTTMAHENGRRRSVYMHRLLMQPGPDTFVDHINGDVFDNRRINLRFATREENARNYKKPVTNTSGFKGVSYNKSKNRWSDTISIGKGMQARVGYWRTVEDSVQAYDVACLIAHGDFARPNLPAEQYEHLAIGEARRVFDRTPPDDKRRVLRELVRDLLQRDARAEWRDRLGRSF